MNNNITTKTYLLYKTTIGELFEDALDNTVSGQNYNYDRVNVRTYERTEAFTPDELAIQSDGGEWLKCAHVELSLYDNTLNECVSSKIMGAIASAGDKVVADKLKEEVYAAPIYACAEFRMNDKNRGRVAMSVNIDKMPKNCNTNTNDLIDAINKMQVENYGGRLPVKLERVEVSYEDYHVGRMKGRIDTLIKRAIKDELAYCLKKGKVIVPKEYLDKGEAGIREWQEKKRSGNKNNSMEKRLIRETLKEKKNKLYHASYVAQVAMVRGREYGIPGLAIDFLYNKGYNRTLITSHLLKDKTDQDIMEMTDEQALAMAKEYWKSKLEEAEKRIDELTLDDLTRYRTISIF